MIHRMMELERGPPFHFTDEKIEASKAKCLYLKQSPTFQQDRLERGRPDSKTICLSIIPTQKRLLF